MEGRTEIVERTERMGKEILSKDQNKPQLFGRSVGRSFDRRPTKKEVIFRSHIFYSDVGGEVQRDQRETVDTVR